VKLLLIVAHPDDETFGCGSLLAQASAAGVQSVVLCATRGELGEVSGDWPPDLPAGAIDPDRLGRIREAELRAATEVLGVSRVEILGWGDSGTDGEPPAGSLVAAATADVAAVIATHLENERPDVVVVPDGTDGHRDHVAICAATLAAVKTSTWRPNRTYVWCIPRSVLGEFIAGDAGTPDESITTVVDTSAFIDLRWRAMRAHATQRPPFTLMSESLQKRFLETDYLIRIDPPFAGEPIEDTWIPAADGAR
jgi:N-acetyl-1-D-myo-inositol-2-amino-2-deoxy-alpha-D-glucopyranoside deacetylase